MSAANAQQTLTTLSQNATASTSGTSPSTGTSGTSGSTSGTSSGSSTSGGTVQTAASLQLTLGVDSAWAGGFGGNISVQNLSGQTLPAGASGWKATLKFPDAVTAASVFQSGPWNFSVAIGSDGTVTLTPPAWAAGLAPGAVTSSGFNGLNPQALQGAVSTTPNVSLQFASSVPASSGSGTSSGSTGSGTTGTTSDTSGSGASSSIPVAPLPTGAVSGGFLFSPYKDVTNSLNWNTNVASTSVTGTLTPLLQVLPSKVPAVTLAFATGQCGSENWGGVAPDAIAKANVPLFTAQNRNYVIATGGAAGAFFCSSASGMQAFINRYASANLVGIDFDIEGGQTQADITALVKSVYDVQSTFPNLRFSFTLATLGSTSGLAGSAPNGDLSPLGGYVMNALAKYPLNNYTINLMVMDYGSPGAGVCVVGSDGLCDMGQTAIQAAKNLVARYGVPYNHIELTPMIGVNDVSNELFSLKDAATMTQWVKANGIAGIHFWSVDRDTPCTSAYASPICSSVPTVPAWGYTQEFIKDLGL
ncbi:MAG TPA: cellulose-binding protein [Methylococcaceae bacterium]|nr:cellulose-binding protein [Methylococcaceae bacterium]